MNSWYSQLSLRAKVTGIALAITTLSLAVVATAGILQIRQQIAVEERRAADAVSLGFSRSAGLEMTVGDTKKLAQLTGSYARDPNLLFVAAYDANGKLITSATSNQTAWKQYLDGQLDPDACIISRRTVESLDQPLDQPNQFSSPTEAGTISTLASWKTPKPIGTIVVGLSTAGQRAAQASQNHLALAVTAIVAGAGALMLFLTLGKWMKRLQTLAEASVEISEGNFTGEINDHGNDEVSRLAMSFDGMRTALRRRDQELRRLTNTLQEQVKRRTSDLQTALNAAEDASKARSIFLANMSHELRAPLSGVIGMVDLLLAAEPNQQQRRYCDIAKLSARSLVELIDDILPVDDNQTNRETLQSRLIDFASAPAKLTGRLDGVRVLLAEDNEVNRLVATELLQLIGCVVTVAVNGYEAVQIALRQQFDVMLMDCQMPILDGFEATRSIRKTEAENGNVEHRKIIALTANAIKGDRELCLAAGMDEYLTKPIDPNELTRTIHALLPTDWPTNRVAHWKSTALAAVVETPASPAPAVDNAPAPIDLELLSRRSVNNRTLAANALRMLDSGIDRDPKAVASSAHKIKGAAANVSAEDLRKIAADLEKLGRADSLDQGEASLESLNEQIAAFRHYLDTALKELTPADVPAESPK